MLNRDKHGKTQLQVKRSHVCWRMTESISNGRWYKQRREIDDFFSCLKMKHPWMNRIHFLFKRRVTPLYKGRSKQSNKILLVTFFILSGITGQRAKPRNGQIEHYKMVKIKPCNQHNFSCIKDTLEVVVYQSEKKYWSFILVCQRSTDLNSKDVRISFKLAKI